MLHAPNIGAHCVMAGRTGVTWADPNPRHSPQLNTPPPDFRWRSKIYCNSVSCREYGPAVISPIRTTPKSGIQITLP